MLLSTEGSQLKNQLKSDAHRAHGTGRMLRTGHAKTPTTEVVLWQPWSRSSEAHVRRQPTEGKQGTAPFLSTVMCTAAQTT